MNDLSIKDPDVSDVSIQMLHSSTTHVGVTMIIGDVEIVISDHELEMLLDACRNARKEWEDLGVIP